MPLTQTLSRMMDSNDQLSSHPVLQEQELWEINFSVFHLSPKYHESQLANTLNLPNDDRLEQSSPMSSSTQLHIPYHKNKKHCRWGEMQDHALSTQTTQDTPSAEPRR